ncbi:MAG TPA: ABC transporter ATP-binding protein [Burkholderiales bacterium]|nr:ABC transporter ATP-binding protein [Burkholderiales bacterium]
MLAAARRTVAVVGRERAPRFALLIALMLAAALLEALGIGAVLPFLGAVTEPGPVLADARVRSALAFLGVPAEPRALVMAAGTAMILLFLLKGGVVLLATWLQGRVLHQQRAELSRALFAHYLFLPYARYLRKNTAHLIHVIAGVTANFSNAFLSSVLMLVSELLVCLTLAALLLAVSPAMTAIAAGFMVVAGTAYVLWSKARLTRIGREQHAATLGLNKSVLEGLGSLKETRIVGAEGYFLRRFDRLAQLYMRYSVRLHVLNNAPRLVGETLFVLVVVGAVMLLSASGRDLKGDLPVMALFALAFMRLLPSFNRILAAFTGARVHAVSLHMLFEELNETRGERLLPRGERPAGRGAVRLERELELRGVSYRYPGEKTPALASVSVRIRKGEVVGLVGKSGAGKSTLVDVVLGLLEPQEGSVLADGVAVAEHPADWQALVGYIPQTIYLMDDTIRRNVALGIEDEAIDEARLRRTLAAAQLAAFVDGLKQGLDTTVGDRGVRLSGGQRQRIGIARALYRDPELLVLDEATSALDVETESEVNEAIRQLGGAKTLIVVAHRLSTVKSCDRLILVDEGRVADEGTYAELAGRNAWFRRLQEILA